MANINYDFLDEILEEIDVVVIPVEFISSACITDLDGNDYYVSIEEAAEIMNSGESFTDQGISAIRAVVDMELVKEVVIELSERIIKSTEL